MLPTAAFPRSRAAAPLSFRLGLFPLLLALLSVPPAAAQVLCAAGNFLIATAGAGVPSPTSVPFSLGADAAVSPESSIGAPGRGEAPLMLMALLAAAIRGQALSLSPALLMLALLSPQAAAQSVLVPDPGNLGAYSISASSYYSGEGPGNAFSAFGACSSSFAWTCSDGPGSMSTNTGYGPAYAGSISTTALDGRSFLGQWIQFCGTSNIDFAGWTMTSTREPSRTPASVVILGSSDAGVTWSVADEHYSVGDPFIGGCEQRNFVRNASSRTAYKCFRWVILASQSANTWMSIDAIGILSNTCPTGSVAAPGTTQCMACVAPASPSQFQDSCLCVGSTYGYGSAACASCAAGATFVSASAGCQPSTTLAASLADTAFYLSGSATEGVAAFALTGAAPTFVADRFGNTSGALALASGSYLSAPGASTPAALPSGGSVPWSAAAWVKCAAPTTWAGALEWGAAGDAGEVMSSAAIVLAVGGSLPAPNSGVVTTLAGSGDAALADGQGATASFFHPSGIGLLPSGDVVVADASNHRVCLVAPDGTVTTLAGSGNGGYANGQGAAAAFSYPSGVAVEPSGAIIVADQMNNRIRRVSLSGLVTTIAGSGSYAFADGQGAAASFNVPSFVAVIPASGNYVVSDSWNHRLRIVTPAGLVWTLAGSGSSSFADGIGLAASFSYPAGVAVSECNHANAPPVAPLLLPLLTLPPFSPPPRTQSPQAV